MSSEILINVTPQEFRVALVKDGLLQEVCIERAQQRGLVGNIYRGKVSRVLPGIQAAFIDIGLTRTGFLHGSDLICTRKMVAQDIDPEVPPRPLPIEDRIKEGDEIIVQICKDAIGSKGARLSAILSLPSRYAVLMPSSRNIGVSQRITDATERHRLRDFMLRLQHDGAAAKTRTGASIPYGLIMRTAAAHVSEDDLQRDVEQLLRLWRNSQDRAAGKTAPTLIHESSPLPIRTLRDLVHGDVGTIRIDSWKHYETLLEYREHQAPDLPSHIIYHTNPQPILDLHSVEDQMQGALDRTVPLQSGGHLVIDQTEAMTTIDVNTGRFAGYCNQEKTFYKTNLEAAQCIPHQLRLRNLGGIIIIDFIDMQEHTHWQQILRALEYHVKSDRARTTISEMSALGLVQMTRKRTRGSLEQVLCEDCSACNGRGKVKTLETICYEIFRKVLRDVQQSNAKQFLIVASAPVVAALTEDGGGRADLESCTGKTIRIQAEPRYAREHYDVVPLG